MIGVGRLIGPGRPAVSSRVRTIARARSVLVVDLLQPTRSGLRVFARAAPRSPPEGSGARGDVAERIVEFVRHAGSRGAEGGRAFPIEHLVAAQFEFAACGMSAWVKETISAVLRHHRDSEPALAPAGSSCCSSCRTGRPTRRYSTWPPASASSTSHRYRPEQGQARLPHAGAQAGALHALARVCARVEDCVARRAHFLFVAALRRDRGDSAPAPDQRGQLVGPRLVRRGCRGPLPVAAPVPAPGRRAAARSAGAR